MKIKHFTPPLTLVVPIRRILRKTKGYNYLNKSKFSLAPLWGYAPKSSSNFDAFYSSHILFFPLIFLVFFDSQEVIFNDIFVEYIASLSFLPFLKDSNNKIMNSNEFLEWFVGFCDGEASFLINIDKDNIIRFKLCICLHMDDREVLKFIKDKLNCGTINKSGQTSVTLNICKIEDLLNIIIPLFDSFPLNGVKYLDYLVLKEAVLIKSDNTIPKEEKLELITKLKGSMNTNRKSYEMPFSHRIRITPY